MLIIKRGGFLDKDEQKRGDRIEKSLKKPIF